MLCAERVKAAVSTLSGLDEGELDEYVFIIESAVNGVNKMMKSAEPEKCALLAAARAAYEIALLRSGGVTSFKAGDVSFTVNADAVKNAKEIYENALADCSDVVNDGGFVFKTV